MHSGQDMNEADCEAGLASETATGRHTEAATAAQEVGYMLSGNRPVHPFAMC